MLYVRYVHSTSPSIFIREKHILSLERVLHKDYYLKGSVEEKISGRDPHGAWRRNELIMVNVSRKVTGSASDSDSDVAFKISYVHEYIIKLCRTEAELILNHVNPNVRGIGQGETRHRKYKRLKLGGCLAYDLSAD
jgi:hypothetical protein